MHRAISQAHPMYLPYAFFLLSVSYFICALHWRILLSGRKWIGPLTTFRAWEAGYLGNSFLPPHAGHVIRTIAISRRTRISASYALATVLTERIMDVLALVLISVASLAALEETPSWLLTATELAAALVLASVLGLLVAPQLERWFGTALSRLSLPAPLRVWSITLLTEFMLGLRVLRHRGRTPSFGTLTIVIWLLDGIMVITVGRAFDLRLILTQALLLLAALGLTSSAPSTPGYVGVYQFVAITVLLPFGFSHDQAPVYILAFQTVTYAVSIVWGGLGLSQMKLAANKESRPAHVASEKIGGLPHRSPNSGIKEM